jgi:hypothetical protein
MLVLPEPSDEVRSFNSLADTDESLLLCGFAVGARDSTGSGRVLAPLVATCENIEPPFIQISPRFFVFDIFIENGDRVNRLATGKDLCGNRNFECFKIVELLGNRSDVDFPKKAAERRDIAVLFKSIDGIDGNQNKPLRMSIS